MFKVKGIGHIGIMVRNVDEAVALYCDLFGLAKPEITESTEQGMRSALVKVGEQAIEIMQPTPGSPLEKFLEQRGEGIHHINLQVEDVELLLKALKEKGMALIEREGSPVVFLHPKSSKGVLIELMAAEKT